MLVKMLAVAAAAMVLSGSARAEDVRDLHGTWVLVSSVTDQFGRGATGMMTLDAGNHFMLTIIGPDLPKFASNNRAAGTPEESKAVVSKSIAMIGTYAHNPTDKTLTFSVESSTFPNWNGTKQKRVIVAATKDELKYITPTASSGGVATVTWRRPNQ
jgi:lipocalin-like protein